jgi:hypothetical protein
MLSQLDKILDASSTLSTEIMEESEWAAIVRGEDKRDRQGRQER